MNDAGEVRVLKRFTELEHDWFERGPIKISAARGRHVAQAAAWGKIHFNACGHMFRRSEMAHPEDVRVVKAAGKCDLPPQRDEACRTRAYIWQNFQSNFTSFRQGLRSPNQSASPPAKQMQQAITAGGGKCRKDLFFFRHTMRNPLHDDMRCGNFYRRFHRGFFSRAAAAMTSLREPAEWIISQRHRAMFALQSPDEEHDPLAGLQNCRRAAGAAGERLAALRVAGRRGWPGGRW